MTKPRADFYCTKKSANSVQSSCKGCSAKLGASTPAEQRAWKLRRNWGLTLDDFDAILQAQGGGCAICGTTAPGGMGRFPIDHCHETGRIRGLLCITCNLGIGGLKDDPALLRRAIAYLESEVSFGRKN